jgi:surface antigen
VNSLTAALKSLTLMVTLSSLGACTSTSPYQSQSISQPTVTGPGIETGLIVSTVGNIYVSKKFSLNDVQKSKQSAAVHAALESDYGKVISWYERDAMGHVKSVHGYPQGRGYCKVIYTSVTVRNRSMQFEETACQNYYDSRGWKFVKK